MVRVYQAGPGGRPCPPAGRLGRRPGPLAYSGRGERAMTIITRRDTLLPDPEPRPVRYTVISVDDHLVEPPDMFEGRLPARFADRAPRIVENSRGHQLWEFDGQRYSQVGMNAVAGRRPEAVTLEPTRFEDMRRGCWDIDARIADMDLNGVWASLNFPSQITGFSGRVFSECSDPELGHGRHPGLERLAVRGLVAALSRPHHPLRHHLPGRPGTRSGRDPAQRRAGLPLGDPARAAPPHRPAQPVLGLLGPDHRRLRGDRHRGLPPRRLVGHAGHARRQSPGGPRGHAVRPDVPVGLRRVAVVGTPGALPRASRSP